MIPMQSRIATMATTAQTATSAAIARQNSTKQRQQERDHRRLRASRGPRAGGGRARCGASAQAPRYRRDRGTSSPRTAGREARVGQRQDQVIADDEIGVGLLEHLLREPLGRLVADLSECEQHLELAPRPDLVERRAESLVEPFHAVGREPHPGVVFAHGKGVGALPHFLTWRALPRRHQKSVQLGEQFGRICLLGPGLTQRDRAPVGLASTTPATAPEAIDRDEPGHPPLRARGCRAYRPQPHPGSGAGWSWWRQAASVVEPSAAQASDEPIPRPRSSKSSESLQPDAFDRPGEERRVRSCPAPGRLLLAVGLRCGFLGRLRLRWAGSGSAGLPGAGSGCLMGSTMIVRDGPGRVMTLIESRFAALPDAAWRPRDGLRDVTGPQRSEHGTHADHERRRPVAQPRFHPRATRTVDEPFGAAPTARVARPRSFAGDLIATICRWSS